MKNLKSWFLKFKDSIFENKILCGIFLLALLLRVLGTSYGFPAILNIDEPSFVRSVIGLRFNLDPNRFDWPHTHLYINFILYTLFYYFRVFLQILNLRPYIESVLPIIWHDPIVFYFISRIVNAFIGALTVIPVFLSSVILLKSRKLALMSALLFSFIPFHVYDSHLALLDTPMAFWVAWFLYFSLRIIKNPTTRNFILSGIFMGLAFGTKYNAFFYYFIWGLCVLYSAFKYPIWEKSGMLHFKNFKLGVNLLFSARYLKRYFLHFLSFLGAYVITNPTVVTNFDLFWSSKYGRGFLFQFGNVGTLDWSEYPNSLLENLYYQSVGDYGYTLYIFIALAMALFIFFNYRTKVNYLTALFPLLMYLYISKKERNPSHYFLFLYPLLAIFVTSFLKDLSNYIASYVVRFSTAGSKKVKEYVLYIIFILLMISPVYESLLIVYRFVRPDTRVMAYEWLQENLTKEDRLYYYGSDLELLPYVNLSTKKIERVDEDYVSEDSLPFYLFLGVKDLTYSDIMEGERDTRKIEGNESRFVNNSDLVFFQVPENQLGPSVFIFKVYSVE